MAERAKLDERAVDEICAKVRAAHVADSVIAELRSRESNGLVVLPDPAAPCSCPANQCVSPVACSLIAWRSSRA
jgi:hypothetical protein